jgi:Ras GTPase-activating-like protein IQGAP2/3
MAPSQDHGNYSSVENSPDQFYRSARKSLRPLPQAPNASSSPTTKRKSSYHARAQTIDSAVDRYPQTYSEDPFTSQYAHEQLADHTPQRAQAHHTMSSPSQSTFRAPDIEELQKSSTAQLRALSRFAESGESEEFGMNGPAPTVVGLHNRRQLKRTDSSADITRKGASRWNDRWMEKQRQFLQAYEYLCHIGEAKEWIENIIHQEIPPVVKLEEALRDGVTLAEIVQAFHPDHQLRIFRNPKLQFKHSDNIVLFFRFLEDVGLPDLFRFELIDLYEKKNIPKVIYCIHALSWLLYRKGMVDFRIGNLVGQLEFAHHELEQTQRGLDKAGVSMPTFSGMGASFGAEPEPEPVETEEDRMDRELHEREAEIVDFQSQIRGVLMRLSLGDNMHSLWDNENLLIDLQSRIRGDWARQIIQYRMNMRRFATNLQASARGYLARSNQQRKEQLWKAREKDVLELQTLVRARKARAEVSQIKSQIKRHNAGIREFQGAVRGALARRDAFDQYEAARESETEVCHVQGAIRGILLRRSLEQDEKQLRYQESKVVRLQAVARAMVARHQMQKQHQKLQTFGGRWTSLQAAARAQTLRQSVTGLKRELKGHQSSITLLQAGVRGAITREGYNALRLALLRQSSAEVPGQSKIRGFVLRHRLGQQRKALEKQLEDPDASSTISRSHSSRKYC